jgi:DNA invertase Pin-like site-specific DNA recombinase
MINTSHQGQNIGYLRVSTGQQNTTRQLSGITLDRVFEEKASAKDTKRPVLAECLKYLREGDTLHIHSLDRLARSLGDLEKLIDTLTGRGVTIVSHKEGLRFTGDDDAMSKLLLQVMGAVAQFERSLINERAQEGREAFKARGGKFGPKTLKVTPEQEAQIRGLADAGVPKTEIAKTFGISRAYVYRILDKNQ